MPFNTKTQAVALTLMQKMKKVEKDRKPLNLADLLDF